MVSVLLQQRAREVVEWRSYEEEQQKLLGEQSAIDQKLKQHLEEYHQKREELAHLSWRQRKAALYRVHRTQQHMRASETTQSDQCSLPIIIKGTCLC